MFDIITINKYFLSCSVTGSEMEDEFLRHCASEEDTQDVHSM